VAKQQPIEIFMPPNTLKAKMGSAGTGLDLAAVKRAEQAMEGLKTEFSSWMNADVERLANCRDAYAAKPDEDAKGDLYRAAHDVKGQAMTFEFPFAARIASSLCKMLDAPGAAPLKLVDAHVDAIRVVVVRNMKDMRDPISIALAEELEARVTGILNAA
jgi:chemotaxis protein histidine kinase CheA